MFDDGTCMEKNNKGNGEAVCESYEVTKKTRLKDTHVAIGTSSKTGTGKRRELASE
jgi:hypothetical protein